MEVTRDIYWGIYVISSMEELKKHGLVTGGPKMNAHGMASILDIGKKAGYRDPTGDEIIAIIQGINENMIEDGYNDIYVWKRLT
jgi:hypothetical protein